MELRVRLGAALVLTGAVLLWGYLTLGTAPLLGLLLSLLVLAYAYGPTVVRGVGA